MGTTRRWMPSSPTRGWPRLAQGRTGRWLTVGDPTGKVLDQAVTDAWAVQIGIDEPGAPVDR